MWAERLIRRAAMSDGLSNSNVEIGKWKIEILTEFDTVLECA